MVSHQVGHDVMVSLHVFPNADDLWTEHSRDPRLIRADYSEAPGNCIKRRAWRANGWALDTEGHGLNVEGIKRPEHNDKNWMWKLTTGVKLQVDADVL